MDLGASGLLGFQMLLQNTGAACAARVRSGSWEKLHRRR